jgi:hypothetical protein
MFEILYQNGAFSCILGERNGAENRRGFRQKSVDN